MAFCLKSLPGVCAPNEQAYFHKQRATGTGGFFITLTDVFETGVYAYKVLAAQHPSLYIHTVSPCSFSCLLQSLERLVCVPACRRGVDYGMFCHRICQTVHNNLKLKQMLAPAKLRANRYACMPRRRCSGCEARVMAGLTYYMCFVGTSSHRDSGF